MSISLLTVLLFSILLVLLILGAPLVFCFGGTAILFMIWQWGPASLFTIATTAYGEWTNFILITVPLFVLMGCLLERSGVADDLYEAMYRWMGPLKGGLAMGTVAICAIFAAMSGISAVATVTMGLIALPSMLKRGYNRLMAVGCISAGGTLGILIPPSVIMIIYASLTGVSVGKLFMGGVFPGILIAIIFMCYIGIRCQLQPHLGPPIPANERFSAAEKLKSLRGVIAPIILILVVLGLLYLGVCTATEAAGLGAIGALVVLFINGRFTWQVLNESLIRTCRLSGMVLWILLGAKAFSSVYTALGASDLIYSIFSGMEVNRWFLMIGMQIILFVMGCFMDPAGIMMICTPVFVPLVTKLGFDTIWFGVLFTINMELGYITPPFGFNLFYMKNLAQPLGVSMKDIYRSIFPFVLLEIVGLIVVMAFPQLALWLPQRMFGG
jgi:tripartite ATP-independent transporter DctM subunit